MFACAFFMSLFTIAINSCDYITSEKFKQLSQHQVETKAFNPDNVQQGDIIYVHGNYLSIFFERYHPAIKHQYILLTNDSDNDAPGVFAHVLDDPMIIAWFGINPSLRHPKFIPIPVGIPSSMLKNGKIEHFNNVTRKQWKKKNLLGMNFNISFYPKERKPLQDYFARKKFCTLIYDTDHQTYLIKMAETRFILSPRGNGLDCFRTWEALYCNTIPIVTTSHMDPLFEELPVLIIDNWKSITPQLLLEQHALMKKKSYNYEKLTFSYWKHIILSYQKDAKKAAF